MDFATLLKLFVNHKPVREASLLDMKQVMSPSFFRTCTPLSFARARARRGALLPRSSERDLEPCMLQASLLDIEEVINPALIRARLSTKLALIRTQLAPKITIDGFTAL